MIIKALGDPSRFVIACLIANTPFTSADFTKELQVGKATVSHHISLMLQAGLTEEVYHKGRSNLLLKQKTINSISAPANKIFFLQA